MVAGNKNRFRFWPIALSAFIAGVFCFVSGMILLDLRETARLKAQENGVNLLTLIGQDLSRSAEMLGLALDGMTETYAKDEVRTLNPGLRQLVLFDRSISARNFGALAIFDINGVIQFDSAAFPPRPIKPVSDRDYFKAQLERNAGLYVSTPYISRLLGEDVIGFSRRLEDQRGSFAGVALATLKLDYLVNLFSRLSLGNGAIISLLRADGTLLARHPEVQPGASRDLSGSPVFQRMSSKENGQFVERSRIDAQERLYTYKKLDGLPLILTVAFSTNEIYTAWWQKAVPLALITLAVSLSTVVMTWFLLRELSGRNAAENALRSANSQLEMLSLTDSLTGLANRRRFDDLLLREARRAGRNSLPLSLILIDADNFKIFNDRYGHAAGDQVLRDIAAALQLGLTRAADQACRVGGEEFGIVLPNTNQAGAQDVAERIRRAIFEKKILHAESFEGVVTVSMGVATLGISESADQLYIRADRALYDAKHSGRNCVRTSRLVKFPIRAV